MRSLTVLGILLMLAAPLVPASAAEPTGGWTAQPKLLLPEFNGLADKAAESVTITLDTALLGMAAKFLDPNNPEDAAAKEVLSGLQGIYVKSYTFDDDFVYPKADVDRVRKQLSAPGWSRLVEVRSRKEQADVDIYISVIGNKALGLAIIATEPREFTIVNIVGSVDLDKLHKLEGKFGVPKLDIEKSKSTTPAQK
ncbi:MAG TPA: DUF4252 domain-containing protein [Steroidobacteraceae bacterium]|nr:DUF4252 domain-containing protein [Steroidobacteraceae bacterium]